MRRTLATRLERGAQSTGWGLRRGRGDPPWGREAGDAESSKLMACPSAPTAAGRSGRTGRSWAPPEYWSTCAGVGGSTFLSERVWLRVAKARVVDGP